MKTCPSCAGSGRFAMDACWVCNGSGQLCSAFKDDYLHVFSSATCGLGTAQLSDESIRALPGILIDERSAPADLIAECPRLKQIRDSLIGQVGHYSYSVIETVSLTTCNDNYFCSLYYVFEN